MADTGAGKRDRDDDATSDSETTDAVNAPAASSPAAAAASGTLVKRARTEEDRALIAVGAMGAVYSCKFSPDGESLASASADRAVYLWHTTGECSNYAVLKGHGNAVLDVDWAWDGSMVFSASTDKFGAVWDAYTGQRLKKLRGHTSFVNSVGSTRRGAHLVCTGSDDGTVRIHDPRSRDAVMSLKHGSPVTAVAFGLAGNEAYSGGVDNTVQVWDLRRREVSLSLQGHADTITSLRLSPEGGHLLSNAMDSTLRIWDVKPFAHGSRCLRVFEGAPHGTEQNLLACAWSRDSRLVGAAAADRTVVVWDAESARILYKLPGHKGCVNGFDFHPKEPIVASASTDKTIYLGELASV